MNVLDENITRDQAELLQQWGIRCRSVSRDFRLQGMHDDNLVPFLLRLKQPTFLTRDEDFFQRRLIHDHYCLAWLAIDTGQTAFYIKRFLFHPRFRASAQRLGKVICVAPHGISYWTKGSSQVQAVAWH